MSGKKKQDTLISIPFKSFIEVTVLLVALLAVSVALTYIIPRGEFGTLQDGQPDYLQYIRRDDLGGIPPLKGIFAPVLVFFSKDGPALIVLSVFLLVISAVFQLVACIAYAFVWKAVAASSTESLPTLYLTASGCRMFAGIVTVLAYCFASDDKAAIRFFVTAFLIYYFIILIYDTAYFMKVEKKIRHNV